MDLCDDPYTILYIWCHFYFVCYKILVSDMSLSGWSAVAYFFGIFQPYSLATELLIK